MTIRPEVLSAACAAINARDKGNAVTINDVRAMLEAAFAVEFGNEECARYTTRRLHEEIHQAEQRTIDRLGEAATRAAPSSSGLTRGSTAEAAAAEVSSHPSAAKHETSRPIIDDEIQILRRLADGDQIFYSQVGDDGWFSKGDRAFVGNAIISLRQKGYLKRQCDDEENYRGLAEYDTISAAGRAYLALKEPTP